MSFSGQFPVFQIDLLQPYFTFALKTWIFRIMGAYIPNAAVIVKENIRIYTGSSFQNMWLRPWPCRIFSCYDEVHKIGGIGFFMVINVSGYNVESPFVIANSWSVNSSVRLYID